MLHGKSNAKTALAEIDEAAQLKDKAQKSEYYARIRDDRATEVRFAEIRLRAIIRIGELSQKLESFSTLASKTLRLVDDAGSAWEQAVLRESMPDREIALEHTIGHCIGVNLSVVKFR